MVVVSGPLFLPSYIDGRRGYLHVIDSIGDPPDLISVPTHFFKVVLTLRRNQPPSDGEETDYTVECAAFVVPNCAPALYLCPSGEEEGKGKEEKVSGAGKGAGGDGKEQAQEGGTWRRLWGLFSHIIFGTQQEVR
jgi:hypothetical protein